MSVILAENIFSHILFKILPQLAYLENLKTQIFESKNVGGNQRGR